MNNKLGTIILVLLTGMLLSACGSGLTGTTGGSQNVTTQSQDVTSQHGTVVLSWAAPTTRTDNSYLPPSELQGYRIYYGTSANNLRMLVDLNDDTITEYSVRNLPSGSYFFAVTAYDSDGTESGYSNLVNKGV